MGLTEEQKLKVKLCFCRLPPTLWRMLVWNFTYFFKPRPPQKGTFNYLSSSTVISDKAQLVIKFFISNFGFKIILWFMYNSRISIQPGLTVDLEGCGLHLLTSPCLDICSSTLQAMQYLLRKWQRESDYSRGRWIYSLHSCSDRLDFRSGPRASPKQRLIIETTVHWDDR